MECPFLGIQLLSRVPRINTKVFVKLTNTRLLLHYHSPVCRIRKKESRQLNTTLL